MKLLIGSTGLIGTTLRDTIKFDFEFNSKNIEDLLKLDIDDDTDLYLSCLPATKWLINKDPIADLDNIMNILNIITKKRYRNVVLYSTIDVYTDAPLGVDEMYIPKITAPNYGSNRLLFEHMVKNTLQYDKLLILRLPALFGKHIKKNIVFDLINNNNIDKINYNSKFQWYNVDNIADDTKSYLDRCQDYSLINLFTEPIHTSEILKIFNIDKSFVDTKATEILYDYKTIHSNSAYISDISSVMIQLSKFIANSTISKAKIAVCLFGEPRDILNRINDWKQFKLNVKSEFYIALYNTEGIDVIVQKLKEELPVKSIVVTDNDLAYFDKLKMNAKLPINLYGIDKKASFCRITSQAYIRQLAVSLVDRYDYNAILLCRTDVSKFAISINDIVSVINANDLMIVNSCTHTHPGGGSGCTKCTKDARCTLEYHANDICDLWCVGSANVMNTWKTFYDNILTNYYNIQVANNVRHPRINYTENVPENEIVAMMSTNELHLIENDVHCYYPEKIIRSAFKDYKIIGAAKVYEIWE